MDKIKLETLGIEFELKGMKYYDLGFTNDMEKTGKHIFEDVENRAHIDPLIENGISKNNEAIGKFHSVIGFKDHFEYYVYYQDSKDKLMNTKVKGHEEAHVLHHCGKLQELKRELKKLGHSIDLSNSNNYSFSKKDPEYVAEIGSLLALEKAGFPILKLQVKSDNEGSYFSKIMGQSLQNYQNSYKNKLIPLRKTLWNLLY